MTNRKKQNPGMKMKPDLVIGVDSSTTATKAIAWDHRGKKVAGAKSTVRLFSPLPNYYEQDAEDWWNSMVKSLSQILKTVDKERIAAIAIANQRESFVALDKENRPVRPAIIWLDERCKNQVDTFASLIGDDRIHAITGKPKDYAPVVYRLSWMKENETDLFKRAKKFCDVQSYLVQRLTGNFRTSRASADPMGLFDMGNNMWSAEILNHLNILKDQLPEVYPSGTILGNITKQAAKLTGLKEGIPLVAGGGDGQAAGLGVNALSHERAYLNLGTAVVSGSFTDKYIYNKSFRTMSSCSGTGYYCETSLRSGTFLIDWFLNQVLNTAPSKKSGMIRQLEIEAEQIEPGCEGLMVLPYWNAVMNPYWDPSARGCIIGLSSGHKRGHIYRAMLEGIAMEQTLATEGVERATGNSISEYAVIGGGSNSKLWRKIIADISGKKVITMSSDEASSLGAGIAAAVGAEWFSSFDKAAENMVHVKEITSPDNKYKLIYKDQITRFNEIYPSVKGILKKKY